MLPFFSNAACCLANKVNQIYAVRLARVGGLDVGFWSDGSGIRVAEVAAAVGIKARDKNVGWEGFKGEREEAAWLFFFVGSVEVFEVFCLEGLTDSLDIDLVLHDGLTG